MRREDEEGGFWHLRSFLFCLLAELSSNMVLKFNLLKLTVFLCLCNGKLWNKTVKLHVTELFTTLTSFHFNASYLPSSPLSCGGICSRLLSPRWFSLSSLDQPSSWIFLTLLFLPFSYTGTNFTFWISVAHFLSAALPELLSTPPPTAAAKSWREWN